VAIHKVIGVMSGTSLDGLDLAYCEFECVNDKWQYVIKAAETVAYNETWHLRLSELHKQPMFLLPKTNAFYGKYIGQCINSFIERNQLQVELISSHGHTIFHNPQEGYTTQIGSGHAIYAETGIRTIYDFRSLDVALGGQGAPLVPIGDELLFAEYDACLNLGGFANISFNRNGKRVAFDICPCNILLNEVAKQAGFPYDENGAIAATGTVNEGLLAELNNLPFYKQQGAKSLGREWVETEVWPIVKMHEVTLEDLLTTFTHHIAFQITEVIGQINAQTVLATGGGVFNGFLLEQLQHTASSSYIKIPDADLVNYKESMIFAFLGVKRKLNEVNALNEVTGASKSSICGALIGF
jgi:anhydro-N-acetylmuramic acid kinase